jgi:hypothetical protein
MRIDVKESLSSIWMSWEQFAKIFHKCKDCDVTLTDSDRNADPFCRSCGRVWEMC